MESLTYFTLILYKTKAGRHCNLTEVELEYIRIPLTCLAGNNHLIQEAGFFCAIQIHHDYHISTTVTLTRPKTCLRKWIDSLRMVTLTCGAAFVD